MSTIILKTLNRAAILQTIKTCKPQFKEFGISTLGLFGSYARNEQSEGSDIDLLIDFVPGHETFDNFMAVCDLLERAFPAQKLEVVTKNGLSPYIGPAILKEVVYV